MNTTQFQSFQRRLKYENSLGSNVSSATGACGKDGKDGRDGRDGRDATTNDVIQQIQMEVYNFKNDVNQLTSNLSTKIDTSLKGEAGPAGPKGEKGDIAVKEGIVFVKQTQQVCVSNNTEDITVINGWSSSLDNHNFSTDSVNILVLKKGKYFITANIDVSNLLTNGVTFEVCENNNNNKSSTTTSKCRIGGPILIGYNSGYLHGILNVESSTSFKILSRDTYGNLTILKSCQLTIVEL